MKKSILWLLAVNLIGGLTLSSCIDRSDNPVTNPPKAPANTNANIKEKSAFSDDIDLSTYAGDDFYQYAVGAWIANNPVPTEDDEEVIGTMNTQAENATMEILSFAKLGTNPIGMKLMSLYNPDDYNSNLEALKQRLQQVDEVNNKDDMFQLMASLMKIGYPTPFFIAPTNMNRKVYPTLDPVRTYEITGKDLTSVGISIADTAAIMKTAREWRKMLIEYNLLQNRETYLGHHNPHAGKRLFKRSGTRASGADFIGMIATETGIDLTTIAADKEYTKPLDKLTSYDLTTLKQLTKFFIVNRDFKYLPVAPKKGNTLASLKESYIITACKDQYSGLNTSMSHTYAEKIAKESAKTAVTAMFEDMRQTFRERIERNKWLSAATKAKALEKLNKMVIYCGKPEAWNTEWEAKDPQKTTAYDMVCDLFAQNVSITRSLMNQTSETALFYSDWVYQNAYEANAFYSPENNSIILLASNLTDPIYDKDQESYYNYGVMGATTLGHEMTHGFDNNGSKYDAEGNINDWWTPNDKSEFEKLQNRMIQHFNKIKYAPGVYTKGKQTLGENIADLGGLEIAYETYMKTVTATGAERDRLGREFYRAFAQGWKQNATPDKISIYEEDEHAHPKVRVNGNVNLTDEWYRLFDIKSGKMYKAPSERITIW